MLKLHSKVSDRRRDFVFGAVKNLNMQLGENLFGSLGQRSFQSAAAGVLMASAPELLGDAGNVYRALAAQA